MAQAINSSMGMTSVEAQTVSSPAYQAFLILRTGFTVAPIVIVANLLMIPGYFDVALRDFGLSLGALALARLSQEHDRS